MDGVGTGGVFASDFNESLDREVSRAFQAALERGIPEEEALRRIEQAVPKAIERATKPIVETLKASGHRMVLEHLAFRQEFESRLLARWLEPLCLFEMFLVGAQEAGAEFNQEQHPEADQRDEFVATALRSLHGRSCLIASEVLHLLRGGFPHGARARWRTLHEIAVIASVVSDHPEVAERYLLHSGVTSARDALEYQARYEALGYEPLSDTEVARLQEGKEELLRRFGKSFRNPYGWAVPLFERKTDPNFRDLEELAGLDHLRSHYRLASHHVHAGPKGDALNLWRRGPHVTILTGPTNSGLAEPGHGALISLYQVTVSYFLKGRPGLDREPIRLVVLLSLKDLLDEAGEAFGRVQGELDAEEEALWAEETEPPNG